MRIDSILLGLPDYRRLAGLVRSLKSERRLKAPHLLRLEEELSGATVLDPRDLPADVVSIGSLVRIREEASGTERDLRLVFPAELDGGEDRVSIFAPLGTALIGERAGATLPCTAPGGTYSVTILDVRPAPSA